MRKKRLITIAVKENYLEVSALIDQVYISFRLSLCHNIPKAYIESVNELLYAGCITGQVLSSRHVVRN